MIAEARRTIVQADRAGATAALLAIALVSPLFFMALAVLVLWLRQHATK